MIQIKTEQLSDWNTLTAFFLNESVRSESSTPESSEKKHVFPTSQLQWQKAQEKSIQNAGYRCTAWKNFWCVFAAKGSISKYTKPLIFRAPFSFCIVKLLASVTSIKSTKPRVKCRSKGQNLSCWPLGNPSTNLRNQGLLLHSHLYHQTLLLLF